MWVGVAHNGRGEQCACSSQLLQGCVCMFVFLCLHARVPSYLEHSYLAKLDAVFCIFIVFFADKSCLSKCKIQVMLRLLSNMSNALEQIHIFKTSVMAQLTVQANMNTDMHAYIFCYTEVTYLLIILSCSLFLLQEISWCLKMTRVNK